MTREELLAIIEKKKREAQMAQAVSQSDVPLPSDSTPEPNMFEKLNQNETLQAIAGSPPIQAVLGTGDALSNLMSRAGSSVISPFSQAMGGPRIGSPEIKSGEGLSYDVGKFIGNVAPYAIPGTAAGRMATGIVGGGLTRPEDMLGGAVEGAIYSGLGELAPEAARGIGKGAQYFADKITRTKYTDDLIKNIASSYEASKQNALSYLNPLMEKYGQKPLSSKLSSALENSYEKRNQYMTPDIEMLKESFDESPTLKKLQDLQSQVGFEMRGLDTSDPAGKLMAQNLKKYRDDLISAMKGSLEQFEPGAGKQYDAFQKEYAKGPAKYQNVKDIRKIIEGQIHGVTPKSLNKSLQKATEGKNPIIPAEHELAKLAPEMKAKLERSNLYTGAGTVGAGVLSGMAGRSFLGPLGYGAGMVGAGMVPYLAPKVANFAFNEELARLLTQAGKGYAPVRAAAVGKSLAPNDEEK